MGKNKPLTNGRNGRLVLKEEEILKIKSFKDYPLNDPKDYFESLKDPDFLKKQKKYFICNTEYKEIKVVKILGVFTYLLEAKIRGAGKRNCILYMTGSSARELAKTLDKCLIYHGQKPKYILKKCGERLVSVK